jgi:crossover junction endodeoxyribonuclease RuvC
MSITGNGQASKEQVADMLKRILKMNDDMTGPFFDATDELAAAYCHYLQLDKPQQTKNYSNWKDFIKKNPNKVIK